MFFNALKKRITKKPYVSSVAFSGFSRKIVDLLNGEGVKYSTFDILSDNEVREGESDVILT